MSSASKAVSIEDLRRLIGEPDFSRGEQYRHAGKVRSARLNENSSRARGEVEETGSRPYRQNIALQWTRDGSLKRIIGDCTCPIGRNCKHVTAVMLTLLPELNGRGEAAAVSKVGARHSSSESGRAANPVPSSVSGPDTRIDGCLGGWLGRLDEIEAPAAPADARVQPERLYYLLNTNNTGEVEIGLFKIRRLKSGELSRNAQRYDLTSNMPTAAFLKLDDISILSQIAYLQRRMFSLGTGIRFDARRLQGNTLVELVRAMIATGRAHALTLQHPPLREAAPRKLHFSWREAEDGTQKLIAVDADARELGSLATLPPLFVDPRDGSCGELLSDAEPRLAHALVSMPTVPPAAARRIASALSRFKAAPTPKAVELLVREDVEPVSVLRLMAVEGRLAVHGHRPVWKAAEAITIPILRPGFDYGGHRVEPASGRDPEFRDGDRHVTIRRDPSRERRTLERLRGLEEYRVGEIDGTTMSLFGIKGARQGDFMFEVASEIHPGHELDRLALALTREVLEPLEAEGWRIEYDPSWPYRFFEGKIEIRAHVDQAEQNWFAFSLTAIAGQEKLDLLPLVLQIIDTLSLDTGPGTGFLHDDDEEEDGLETLLDEMVFFIDLPDGSRVPVEGEELVPLVRACLAARWLLEGFHPGEAGELKTLAEALEGSGIALQGGEALLELGSKLQDLREAPEIEPPASLRAELRHYQKSGYGWLKALAETGFGGVLADDMGLGKTVQTLALLCQRHLEEGTDRPSLLVVPTSLIANWQREAARFAPQLRLLVLHGPNRHDDFERMAGQHLIVTTYPLLHRDAEKLFAQAYEIAILDEAQAVKNPASAAAKLIRDVDARQRLALTGTPIENSLEELWAIYDWVVPGLLGNRKSFRQKFRHKIEQGTDKSAQERLANRIRPFLLRRTKEEVATDLPPKTEINEFVRLEGRQRELYETVRVAMDARVREAIARHGIAGTRITVLDALLKMRQACCDPGLVKLDAARKVKESAKRKRLLEMLEELLAEGRRVLLFSQFVEMLRLIEGDLQARGLDYTLLTGETQKRAEIIDRFQSGEVPLFLISLKAGGVGLNLTAADTVIIYDPWWNPAVERQAMDRTHRIGQDKPVFVYKMIAEGSVEAAIQNMQERKQALADNLFAGTGSGGLNIDQGDIEALFAPIDQSR